jgi:hypothetical protein
VTADPYRVLEVSADASQEDIRRAWVDLARRHHPDRGGDAAAMQALNEAWALLGDPVRRRSWDRDHGPDRGRDARASAVEIDEDPSVDADLFDPRPLMPARQSPVDLLPVAVFAGAVGTACLALVLDEPGLLAFAGFLFFLSCVAVAAVAMLSMRRSLRSGRR